MRLPHGSRVVTAGAVIVRQRPGTAKGFVFHTLEDHYGLINVITPDPSFTPRGRVAAKWGRLRNEANDVDVRGYFTTGLSEKVAFDIAGLYRETDPYIKELNLDDDLGSIRVFDVRSKLLFRPSDRVQFIITGGYTDQKSTINASQPLDNNTIGKLLPGVILPDGPWQSSSTTKPRIDYEKISLSLRGRVEFEATAVA